MKDCFPFVCFFVHVFVYFWFFETGSPGIAHASLNLTRKLRNDLDLLLLLRLPTSSVLGSQVCTTTPSLAEDLLCSFLFCIGKRQGHYSMLNIHLWLKI